MDLSPLYEELLEAHFMNETENDDHLAQAKEFWKDVVAEKNNQIK